MADRRTKSRRRLAARADLPPTDRRLRVETEERAPSGSPRLIPTPRDGHRRRTGRCRRRCRRRVAGAGRSRRCRSRRVAHRAHRDRREIRRDQHLVFQNVLRGEDYAEVSIARLATPGDRRRLDRPRLRARPLRRWTGHLPGRPARRPEQLLRHPVRRRLRDEGSRSRWRDRPTSPACRRTDATARRRSSRRRPRRSPRR